MASLTDVVRSDDTTATPRPARKRRRSTDDRSKKSGSGVATAARTFSSIEELAPIIVAAKVVVAHVKARTPSEERVLATLRRQVEALEARA